MIGEPTWLLILLTITVPIYESSELSIQAQLNQLSSRVTKLEGEVKTLKVIIWTDFLMKHNN